MKYGQTLYDSDYQALAVAFGFNDDTKTFKDFVKTQQHKADMRNSAARMVRRNGLR
jgi:hypothetical protein